MEVRSVLGHMRSGGTPGLESTRAEVIGGLEEFGEDWISGLLNTLCDTGDMLPDLGTSVFIAIARKAGALNFGQHRAVSLVSRVTNILLGIIVRIGGGGVLVWIFFRVGVQQVLFVLGAVDELFVGGEQGPASVLLWLILWHLVE